MGGNLFLRIFGALVFTWLGVILADWLVRAGAGGSPLYWRTVLGLLGTLTGLTLTPWLVRPLLTRLRRKIMEIPAETMWAAIIGIILGWLLGNLFTPLLQLLPYPLNQILTPVEQVFFMYLGAQVFIARKNDLLSIFRWLQGPRRESGGPVPMGRRYVLDTSALIDGRIVEIVRLGFMEGEFVVPRFVLFELQSIADAPEPERRRRGRRGLEMLEEFKRLPKAHVRISDIDPMDVHEVDHKIVAIARRLGAPIITTDYNLAQIARLRQVSVLNLHDLEKIMQPPYLPGDRITITVTQEGKGANQGVGFLPDGTMIVVEDGKDFIGQQIDVVLTKVLQTTGGRIIFARPVVREERR
ncbi:MAG: PIN domain-containing protein [Chloroflexi bacterium]|nr:PIN domain-containing protein [Chloroflexota bacterium]